MNKQLVGTLVGGIILFFWQFLSWAMLNIHGAETQYTPKQDQILEALAKIELDEGSYLLPNVPPDQLDQQEELMKPYLGKPWAQITYHKSFDMNMGMNMLRAFVIDLLAAFLLVWLLMKFREKDMMTCVLASLAIGAIGYLTIPYLNTIWFKTSSMGYLVDTVVQWGLVGAWLGWWLNRK